MLWEYGRQPDRESETASMYGKLAEMKNESHRGSSTLSPFWYMEIILVCFVSVSHLLLLVQYQQSKRKSLMIHFPFPNGGRQSERKRENYVGLFNLYAIDVS